MLLYCTFSPSIDSYVTHGMNRVNLGTQERYFLNINEVVCASINSRGVAMAIVNTTVVYRCRFLIITVYSYFTLADHTTSLTSRSVIII